DAGGKTDSATVSIVVNGAPSVTIASPAPDSVFSPGDTVVFTGTTTDPEQTDLSAAIDWSSDLDGPLGSGASVSVNTLQSGTHTITATVTDAGGKTDSATVSIVVNGAPSVTITGPAGDTVYSPGDTVVLTGTATDPEQTDLSAAIDWTSDLDGSLGTGASVSVSTLQSGTHVITATIVDAGGKTDSATVSIVVNGAPTVTITAPAPDSVYNAGDTVVLTGTALDPEQTDLSPAIDWSSDLDGPLGSGASMSVYTLRPGAHVITASVTDAGGKSDSATVSVTVND